MYQIKTFLLVRWYIHAISMAEPLQKTAYHHKMCEKLKNCVFSQNTANLHVFWHNHDTETSGGSKGGREGRTPPPPSASKFFQFHAVFGRIRQNCVFTPPPPWRVHAPPPWGNPGSVTGNRTITYTQTEAKDTSFQFFSSYFRTGMNC